MFDEEPRGETAATKSFFFISIDPFFLRVPVVIFARSLGSLDSRISRVRSLRRSSRARLSRETITSVHRILSSKEAANRILFFAVFSLSGSSTSDVECDNRG